MLCLPSAYFIHQPSHQFFFTIRDVIHLQPLHINPFILYQTPLFSSTTTTLIFISGFTINLFFLSIIYGQYTIYPSQLIHPPLHIKQKYPTLYYIFSSTYSPTSLSLSPFTRITSQYIAYYVYRLFYPSDSSHPIYTNLSSLLGNTLHLVPFLSTFLPIIVNSPTYLPGNPPMMTPLYAWWSSNLY